MAVKTTSTSTAATKKVGRERFLPPREKRGKEEEEKGESADILSGGGVCRCRVSRERLCAGEEECVARRSVPTGLFVDAEKSEVRKVQRGAQAGTSYIDAYETGANGCNFLRAGFKGCRSPSRCDPM